MNNGCCCYYHFSGSKIIYQSSTSISTSSSSEHSLLVVWSVNGDSGDIRNLFEISCSCADNAGDSDRECPSVPLAHFSRSASLAIFSKGTEPIALADSTSAFISSKSLFSFALRFWNQVMTWAFVSPSCWAIWSRSAGDKYFWYKNLFSSSYIWWFVKAVLDFLRFLGVFLCPNRVIPSRPVKIN